MQVILAARSEYFRALLFGGMRESNQEEVELGDTSLPAFRHLLRYLGMRRDNTPEHLVVCILPITWSPARYIYTGNMSLNSFKEDLILDLLGLAHLYGFQVCVVYTTQHYKWPLM